MSHGEPRRATALATGLSRSSAAVNLTELLSARDCRSAPHSLTARARGTIPLSNARQWFAFDAARGWAHESGAETQVQVIVAPGADGAALSHTEQH